MPRISRSCLSVLIIVGFVFAAPTPATGQSRLPSPRSRILQSVDDSRVTKLSGNTHPLARPEFDQGALADATPLSRIVLLLQRSPDQESALQQLIDQQQDTTSSTYHQWLTPESFGAAFGPSDRDLSIVTTWLSDHNFTGITVNAARTIIEFSGTAGSVRSAFRTNMHRYAVEGQQHFANSSDPAIPAALAPVVAGIASLNNFPRRASSHKVGTFRRDPASKRTMRLPSEAQPEPNFTINSSGETTYGLTPYDFATIYNILPLWNAATPIDGTGQTIAIVGQTDINPADFVNFRKLFNLPLGDTATPTGTQYLNIIYNGPNPGVTGDEGEADIDTQWSAAVAKGATIDYVVSQGTEVMQGTDLSAIYIIDNNLAPVMSYSYGQCELFLGTSGNAFYKALWQQAAAQGITVLVASGDSGAAGCDGAGVQGASNGLGVNGLASTPYNISVGGTDFYMPNGGGAFWNPVNNSTTEASARGYIPETPWNESCTNSLFSTFSTLMGQTPQQICNSAFATSQALHGVVGSGGGPSSCTQSNGSSPSSCRGGYAKPSWQAGPGVPADGVRDTPDVSLFASAGFFGAFYIVCQQSTNYDGQPCSLSAAYDFAGYGGTSVASPAFAGILSLINQKTGSRQGNANYVLYNLASQQSKSGSACSSISGSPAAGCVFNDITTDTIAMPCLKGTPNCSVANSSDRYGVLSAYTSTAGYDFASGLGSVNAANLVNNWSNASFVASSTTLTLSAASITHGSPVSAAVKVASTTGTPTGSVSINALAANGSILAGTLQNGNYSASLGNFPGGFYSVQAHYGGDGTYAASDSNTLALTVSPEPSNTTLRSMLYNPAAGTTTNVGNGATYPYGGYLLIRADVAGRSGQGSATGNILLTDSGAPLDGGTFRLNSTSNTEDQTRALSPGTHVITGTFSGDASFNASISSPLTLNITRAPTASALTVTPTVLSAASTLTLTAQVSARGYGANALQGFGAAAPGGLVTFTSAGIPLGNAVLTQSTYPSSSSDSGSVTISLPASLLPVGSNAITVSYAGDLNYSPSTGTSATVVVTGSTQSASITAIGLSAESVSQGDPYTFTALVSPAQSGARQPTGTITFMSDGRPVGLSAPLIAGTASLSGSTLGIAPGTHAIAALYSGDPNYQASVSPVSTFTIHSSSLTSATSIAINPANAVQGTAITVTASIDPTIPIPTGTAQLVLDGTLYGARVSLTGATANLPLLTNTLQTGPHVVQVLYSGDSAHLSSISASAMLTILDPTGAFTLSPSSASTIAAMGKASSPITLTVTPTGGFHSTITFACAGGLPAGAICSFSPSAINSNAANPGTTTLTIVTASSVRASADRAVSPHSGLTVDSSGSEAVSGGTLSSESAAGSRSTSVAVAFAGLLLIFVPRRSRRWSILVLLLSMSTLAVLSGCGSGGVDPNGANPAALSSGSYAVTVTATGGSTIQTVTVNLTVQ